MPQKNPTDLKNRLREKCGFSAGNGRGNRESQIIYFNTLFIIEFYFSRFPLPKPAKKLYIYL